MTRPSSKRLALNKLSLTGRTIEALKPVDKSWIAWDDRLTGFGVRVQPTGLKSFIVNYRAGDGGRKAPNRRIVLGRHGDISAVEARRMARQVLVKAARGEDPAGERAEARRMPVLEQAFEDFMAANPKRASRTDKLYREEFARHFADWRERPLDAISRRDVEARFKPPDGRQWLVAGQSGDLAAALDLSPPLRRSQRPAQPGRSVACRWRQVSPQQAAQDFHPVGGPAVLEDGYRGCGEHAARAGCFLVRALHRHAPQRGAAATLALCGLG